MESLSGAGWGRPTAFREGRRLAQGGCGVASATREGGRRVAGDEFGEDVREGCESFDQDVAVGEERGAAGPFGGGGRLSLGGREVAGVTFCEQWRVVDGAQLRLG